MTVRPETTEGSLGGRPYRKSNIGPFASYPPAEADFVAPPIVPAPTAADRLKRGGITFSIFALVIFGLLAFGHFAMRDAFTPGLEDKAMIEGRRPPT